MAEGIELIFGTVTTFGFMVSLGNSGVSINDGIRTTVWNLDPHSFFCFLPRHFDRCECCQITYFSSVVAINLSH